AAEPETAPTNGLRPDSTAYVIYTSGSTGIPKGVMGIHRATVNRIVAQSRIAPFLPSVVCCQQTSTGFVDSIFEILGPLAHGVPLVVVCETTPADPDELSIEIEGRGVTNLIAVPSLAAALISQSQLKRRLTALRTWTLSGEVLPAELLQQLTQALP